MFIVSPLPHDNASDSRWRFSTWWNKYYHMIHSNSKWILIFCNQWSYLKANIEIEHANNFSFSQLLVNNKVVLSIIVHKEITGQGVNPQKNENPKIPSVRLIEAPPIVSLKSMYRNGRKVLSSSNSSKYSHIQSKGASTRNTLIPPMSPFPSFHRDPGK